MTARSKIRPSSQRRKTSPPLEQAAAGKRRRGTESDTQRLVRRWRDAVPNDRMAHLVKDATRALVRALQMRLAEHDIPFGHWTFLRILWERDGLTQRELSREAGVMEPTTFAALKAMEARGHIERRQLAGNRRKVHIFLTAQGRALKRTLVPLAEDVNRIAVRGVAPADIAAARRALLAILVNLARDELHSLSVIVDRAGKAGRARLRTRSPEDAGE